MKFISKFTLIFFTLIFLALILAITSILTFGPKQASADVTPPASTFSWDNATVYFVMTDRFVDGDASNNHSYGRELDLNGNPYSDYKTKVGTFHGGDLKGLTQKVNDNYFNDLGVNAIWITAPYEQIHGWVGGLNFRHYSYHGYYVEDYTELDKNMGTESDLTTFIDTAHQHGIRVVFDVVMNHTGYETMKDMNEFNYGELNTGWQDYYYNQPEANAHYETYNTFISKTSTDRWSKWWGTDWIRTAKPGYDACGGDEKKQCLSDLPDFKTESTKNVGLPPLLQTKWDNTKETKELTELNSFFSRTGKPPIVRNYIIKWLTDWVREYGVDGFRVDTAKHVDLIVEADLKIEAVQALRDWKAANPTKKMDDTDFWMTGEVWGHGVGRSTYFDNGFDSLINFTFQGQAGNIANIDSIYTEYASKINPDPTFNMLSYISSHDTSLFDRNNLMTAGSTFMMLPGGIQIYYGDETGRQPTVAPWDQPTRSDMNWGSINQTILAHWQKLGQFRKNHIAVGAGDHKKLQSSPYAFSRTYNKNNIQDNVVVAFGASGNMTINVSSVFANGATVRDAYTGNTAVVSGGKVSFVAHANGVILLEQTIASTLPNVSALPAGGTFKTDSITVTLNVDKATSGKYTLDGSDPSNGTDYTNGTPITFGSDMAFNESKTLKLYAVNADGASTQPYVFTKKDPNGGLTIHYKKPAAWGAPKLYYYATVPVVTGPTWATAPAMVLESGDWYSYKIDGVDSATVIFKDSNGNQLPVANQAGFTRTSDGWYSTQWFDSNPDDSIAPTIPTNIAVTAKTGSTVSISWTASTDNVGVTGYDVYRNNVKVGTTTTTTYTDTGLIGNTAYSYTVKALDAVGNASVSSSAINVTTDLPEQVAPTAPTNLAAVSKTDTSVSLSWTASTDNVGVTGYDVYRNNVKVGTAATTTFTDTGLIANTAYHYTVQAKDAAGNVSLQSNLLAVTTNAAPDGLTIHYKKPASWGTLQMYYYATSPAVTGPTWATSPVMVAESGGWYSYKIIGVTSATIIFKDSNGNQLPAANQAGLTRNKEGWYNGQWFDSNPDDAIAPTIPTNFAVTAKTDTSVSLSWTASTDNVGVTGYDVYRNNVKVGATATTTYTDSGLIANTAYEYTVTAKDLAGNVSPSSSLLAVTTNSANPGNQVTIYYKQGYTAPYIHYRAEGGTWTATPGVAMPASEIAGYNKITFNIGTATRAEVCFNNGSGTWDCNGGSNYFFSTGTSTYIGSGAIVTGPPVANSLVINLSVPSTTTIADTIYLSGTLNAWLPADANSVLTKNADGTYSITLTPATGTNIQFKFTRGSWATAEVNANGSDLTNRSYTYTGGAQIIKLTVLKWKDK